MKSDATPPLLKFNKRFKKISYKVILIVTLHWTLIAPAQPLLESTYSLFSKSIQSFLQPDDEVLEGYVEHVSNTKIDIKDFEENPKTLKAGEASKKVIKTAKAKRTNNAIPLRRESKRSLDPTIYKADMSSGRIGIFEDVLTDSPSDNVFSVNVGGNFNISNEDKVFLKYEVKGVQGVGSVARSINARPTFGGYIVKSSQKWLEQNEEINPKWIRKGRNSIFFTVPENAPQGYEIRNVQIKIERGIPNTVQNLLVIHQREVPIKKGNKIYISGFIKSNIQGKLYVVAGITHLRIHKDEFEGFIDLQNSIGDGMEVPIKAFDDSGLLGQEIIRFKNDFIEAERIHPFESGNYGTSVSSSIASNNTKFAIYVQGKDITFPETNMILTKVRNVDIAPLSTGILNVTKNANAYRIKVSQKDKKALNRIHLQYDEKRLPSGYSSRDVKTFYFDNIKKGWEVLVRDSINEEKQTVFSQIAFNENGDTDYINGIIQAPEASQTNAYMPTAMSDIKAVNPSSQMTIIAPPSASQKGDANISYPIRIPAGRKGMQPSVGLQYNSEAGNGWLGMGWSLSAPAITLDTRWGAPVFQEGNESEMYSLNGEMLMYPNNHLPHRQTGDTPETYTPSSQKRISFLNENGNKTFTPRKQGSFAQIERIGDATSVYYWKVVDATGTTSWYGGDESGIIENAIVRNDDNHIVHWALVKVEDVFANNMIYQYTNSTLSGEGNLTGGTYFYTSKINYTGENGNEGNYEVVFLTTNTVKTDATINGKLGLKWIDPYNLDEIKVTYKGNLIRSYKLDMDLARFDKNLLISIVEKDKNGNEFYKHDFEYYDDITDNDNALYRQGINIDIPTLGTSFANNFGQQVLEKSVLSSSESIEKGIDARLASGIELRPFTHSQDKTKTVTVGAPFGENNFRNKGKISLSDMNGDGLDDVLFRTSNGLRFIPNESQFVAGELINTFENSNEETINNAFDFFKSKGSSKTMFGESYDLFAYGFYAGTSRIKNRSESNVYLTDGNGDGLLDIVRNETVYFNQLNITGEPTFSSSSLSTENLVLTAGSGISDWVDPDEEIPTPEEESIPTVLDFDAVRVWVAPRAGLIKISSKIQAVSSTAQLSVETQKEDINDNLPFRIWEGIATTTTEFLQLELYENNAPLGLASQGVIYDGKIEVDRGQKIYFRLHQGGSNPAINWNPTIDYIDVDVDDENGISVNRQRLDTENYAISGDGLIVLPDTGIVSVSWTPLTVIPHDELIYRITRTSFNPDEDEQPQSTIVYQKTCPPGISCTIQNQDNEMAFDIQNILHIDSDSFVSFQFEVDCDSNEHWISNTEGAADFNPTVNFNAFNSENSFVSNPIPQFPIYRAYNYDSSYISLIEETDFTTPPDNLSTTRVKPSIDIANSDIFSNTDVGEFNFVVKNYDGLVIDKRIIKYADNALLLEDSSGIDLFQGSIDNQSPENLKFYFGFYAKGANNSDILEKYIMAIGQNETITISHDFNNNNKSFQTSAIEFYANDISHLGSLGRSWGRFFYNENYNSPRFNIEDDIGALIEDSIVENPTPNQTFFVGACDPSSTDYVQCVLDSFGIPEEGSFDPEDPSEIESIFDNIDNWIEDNNYEFPEISFIAPTATRNIDFENGIGWKGMTENQYISYRYMKTDNLGASEGSSGTGGDGPLADGVTDTDTEGDWEDGNLSTGMIAIDKIDKSSTRTYGAGYEVTFNISETGYSRGVTDFMDINGDSYPDLIYTDNFVRSSMTGGHTIQGDHGFGDPRSFDNSNQGFSIPGKLLNPRSSKPSQSRSTNFDTGSAISRAGISLNVSGENIENTTFADLNGDGLVDRITKGASSFLYQLNKGDFSYDSSSQESFDLLESGISSPASLSLNFGIGGEILNAADIFSSGIFSGAINFDIGASASQNNIDITFQDINGDGLSDLVYSNGDVGTVRYNNGHHFQDTTFPLNASGSGGSDINLKGASRNRAVAGGIDGSGFFGFPICCPVPPFFFLPLIHVKFGATIGGNVNLAISDTKKAFKDFNGDGFVDFLEQKNNQLKVHYSAIGRTNKLKTVNNPLGGSFTVDYNPQAKTYGNPNAKWVMKSVIVNDGYDEIVHDGESEYITEFQYADGIYDRRERQFYGYGEVRAFDYESNLEDIYRTTVSDYHNDSYFLEGLLKESRTIKGAVSDGTTQEEVFSLSQNTYEIYGLEQDNQKIDLASLLPQDYDVGGTEGRGTAAVLLTETKSEVYELENTPLTTRSTMEYDFLGRVISYTNEGDITSGDDDYVTNITYHQSTALDNLNLIQIPKRITVIENGTLKRRRIAGGIDQSTGTVGKIFAKINDTENTITRMNYDQYGNLIKIIYPANFSGDSMFYEYTYDTEEHKYVIETKDAFNYKSEAWYDPEFDTLLETKDIAGNQMIYTYDDFGRTTSILAPKEIENGADFTISYSYYPNYESLDGVANVLETAFVPIGLTRHFDQTNSTNTIDTYTFIDGLARVIQVKKDIKYRPIEGTNENMTISGKIQFDHLGRGIRSYHPTSEKKDTDTNFTINNNTVTFFEETTYDELDRPILVKDPGGNLTAMTYKVTDNLHTTTTSTQQSNAVNVEVRSYHDPRGRNVKTTQVDPDGNLDTTFTYNAINELLGYTDAEGITTTCEYDLLGRKILKDHPDNGTTKYIFDNASNLIQLETEKLGIAGESISYGYEFNRLNKIIFPETGGNPNISNVSYDYGDTNAGNNTGRLIYQEDATGTQLFEYGNMGEITKNVRAIVAPNLPDRVFETSFTYDSWNRLLKAEYPDKEVVTYDYNFGGDLTSIEGQVNGSLYKYVKDIRYNYFGEIFLKIYGNGTREFFQYENDLRRLKRHRLTDRNNKKLLDNRYTYDKADNIKVITNLGTSENTYNLGGNYEHVYSYDVLNRLSYAEGNFSGNPLGDQGINTAANYELTMEYTDSHGIARKSQLHRKGETNITIPENTYGRDYAYIEGTHKLQKITDATANFDMVFDYDPNGNIKRIISSNANNTSYFWDESNRLRVVEDETMMHHYIYDAGDQRVLKSSSDPTAIYENGTPVFITPVEFNNYTTYPSNLIVVKPDGEYTKHYFAGSNRVLSRIGEGDFDIFDTFSMGGEDEILLKNIKQRQVQDIQRYANEAGRGAVSFKKYLSREEREALQKERANDPDIEQDTKASTGDLYFFHGDHLGTASFITDGAGEAYQFFATLPFGETLVEQHSMQADYENRWKFNGKELDQETGLYYYGARYYNPSLSVWMSIDPLAESMPEWSPYNYAFNNPLRFTDPTGLAPEDFVLGKNGNIYWDDNANSQATTQSGDTYLGKELSFTFNSTIDANLWDGPGGDAPAGDKLTSTVNLSASENSDGQLTGITATSDVEIGSTPLGTARDFFPGLGDDQNKFSSSLSTNSDGTLSNFSLNFEQHASVSPIEGFGLNLMGYDIVNVAQKLDISTTGSNLSISASTDVFPSASLSVNGNQLFNYSQPSFKGTHGRSSSIGGDNGRGGVDVITTPRRPAPSFHLRYKN